MDKSKINSDKVARFEGNGVRDAMDDAGVGRDASGMVVAADRLE